MNTISGISFYDALCKLAIGFLLTWFWMPEVLNGGCTSCSCYNCVICEVCRCSCCIPELNAIQTVLFTIVCFITGCFWQSFGILLSDLCSYIKRMKTPYMFDYVRKCKCFLEFIPIGKRNYPRWIQEQKRKVYASCHNVMPTYLLAYYNVQKEGMDRNIKIIEALEAFLRELFGVECVYIIILIMRCVSSTSDKKCDLCLAGIMVISLVFTAILWRFYNKRIYFLVWEADKYVRILKKSS